MARKYFAALALAIGLTFAVGCSGSSSTSVLSKEEQEKKQKEMIDKQKAMMPGAPGKPPEGAPMGGAAPMGEKK